MANRGGFPALLSIQRKTHDMTATSAGRLSNAKASATTISAGSPTKGASAIDRELARFEAATAVFVSASRAVRPLPSESIPFGRTAPEHRRAARPPSTCAAGPEQPFPDTLVPEACARSPERQATPDAAAVTEWHPTVQMWPRDDDIDRTDLEPRNAAAESSHAMPALGAHALRGGRPAFMLLATLALAFASAFVGLSAAQEAAYGVASWPISNPSLRLCLASAGSAMSGAESPAIDPLARRCSTPDGHEAGSSTRSASAR